MYTNNNLGIEDLEIRQPSGLAGTTWSFYNVLLKLYRCICHERWIYHAGSLVTQIFWSGHWQEQLRDQLVECNSPPAVFVRQRPKNHDEVFRCCFQSAKRCEVNLNLDRLHDTMLGILTLLLDAITPLLLQDLEFCSDKDKTLEQWNLYPSLGASNVKGI